MNNIQNTLDVQTKAKYKRALIAAGINPSGMSDAQLISEHYNLNPIEAEQTVEPITEHVDTQATVVQPTGSKAPIDLVSMIAKLGLDETALVELIKKHASTQSGTLKVDISIKFDQG